MGNFPKCETKYFCVICLNGEKQKSKNNLENEEIQDCYNNQNNKFPINKEMTHLLNMSACRIQEAYRNYILRQNEKENPQNETAYKEINLEKRPIQIANKTSSNNMKSENSKINSTIIDPLEKKLQIEKLLQIEKKITLNKKKLTTRSSIFSNYSDYSIISKNAYTMKPEIYGYFLKKPNKILNYIGEKDKITKKKNGFGIVTWEDKSELSGYFKDNKVYGICKFKNSQNKSIYFGEYENNIPKGFGSYKSIEYKKEGYWEKYRLNGIGYEIWEDLSFYQGNYERNKKNGIGVYRWPDQTIYQGEWKDNQITGTGILYYNDKRIYCGELLNGNMHGFGVFTWPNSQKYIGYFKYDLKCGFGIYAWTLKPLNAFVGFWDKGKQNGVGAKFNGSNIKYGVYIYGRKDFNLKGDWEIKKYLLPEEYKYQKFLFKSDLVYLLKSLDL